MPLIINGTEVNKISGPVSMYILTPKRNKVFPNLPAFMLFGDIHRSTDNMCEDKSEGTLDVYSVDFLSLLNTMATREEPVDFYIEGGDIHNRQEREYIERKYPLDKFWNLYIECPNRGGKKLALYPYDEKKCERIKNVRWHSGDARFFSAEKHRKQLCGMYSILRNVNFDEFEYDYKSLQVSLMLFKKYDQNYDYCIRKILNESMLSFEDIIFAEDGLVWKQLKKINDPQKSEMIKYIRVFCEYYTDLLKKYYDIDVLQKIEETLIRLIKSYHENNSYDKECLKYIEEEWHTLRKYFEYLESKNTIVLDIYTICRSFKYIYPKEPKAEDAKPIMNILYTGDFHTQNIIHFLEQITGLYNVEVVAELDRGDEEDEHEEDEHEEDEDEHEEDEHDDEYDQEEEYPGGYPNRCIEIKNNINLNDIIKNVRKLRTIRKPRNIRKLRKQHEIKV